MSLDPTEFVTCFQCNRDYPADLLCEHEDPVCLPTCCEVSHPIGRMPWEVAA